MFVAREMRLACVKGKWRKIDELARQGADVNLRNNKDWQRYACGEAGRGRRIVAWGRGVVVRV
jgi:hypothetical protein